MGVLFLGETPTLSVDFEGKPKETTHIFGGPSIPHRRQTPSTLMSALCLCLCPPLSSEPLALLQPTHWPPAMWSKAWLVGEEASIQKQNERLQGYRSRTSPSPQVHKQAWG